MGKFIDLTGQRFGRLGVIERVQTSRNRTFWKCICDCGNEKIVNGGDLVSGHTRSCGCYKLERMREGSLRHGKSNTRLEHIWANMRSRCYNKKHKYYDNYGSRGIVVCNDWLISDNFYKWAENNGYADNLEIDRIDSNGNYCPENCRWVNKQVQNSNTRRNRYFIKDGKKLTLSECARELGCDETTILGRLSRGWDEYRAITEPTIKAGTHKRKVKEQGCSYPECHSLITSPSGLCHKHYNRQMWRLKQGKINSLLDFSFPDTGKGIKQAKKDTK